MTHDTSRPPTWIQYRSTPTEIGGVTIVRHRSAIHPPKVFERWRPSPDTAHSNLSGDLEQILAIAADWRDVTPRRVGEVRAVPELAHSIDGSPAPTDFGLVARTLARTPIHHGDARGIPRCCR